MRFDGFLGNAELKKGLSAAFSRGKISHSYLLAGPEGSGKRTLARILAAAMQCTGGGETPCGRCTACRKVLDGQHPDVITVDDPEHKNLSVDLVRETRADVFLRPNEGKRKVYIIPRAQDLGLPSQNALLKILEEPPDYAVFLLLTTNVDAMLPTIRSRCVELRLQSVPEREALAFLREKYPDRTEESLHSACLRSAGFLGQALQHLDDGLMSPETAQFAEQYAARSALGLLSVLVPLEKSKRDQLLPLFAQWKRLLADALAARAGLPAPSPQCAAICRSRTGAELLSAANDLQTAMDDLSANVGVGPVIGWLTIRLR
jgi:DNA polymerase-3 subunit delta'